MSEKNVKDFFKAVFKKNKDEYFPMRYDDYVYHTFKKAYVCRVQLVGTKNFMYLKPSEILNNDDMLSNFSSKDALEIKNIHLVEESMRGNLRLKEIDHKKGTVLFEDSEGRQSRYAEKTVVVDEELQRKISSKDAAEIGYRAGLKDGIGKSKKQVAGKLKSAIIKKLPFNKKN